MRFSPALWGLFVAQTNAGRLELKGGSSEILFKADDGTTEATLDAATVNKIGALETRLDALDALETRLASLEGTVEDMNKPDGSSPADAAASIEHFVVDNPLAPSGVYYVYINGTPTEVYINMDVEDGGWALGMNIHTSDGHMVYYGNDDFWTSTSSVSRWAGGTTDAKECFNADYKAINQGNLFEHFQGKQLMVLVHDGSGTNYYGYRVWDLEMSHGSTAFVNFFEGGDATHSGLCSSSKGGTISQVDYYKRITNGSTASKQTGPAGNLWSKTPNSYEDQDLVTNASNGYNDANRLTQVNAGSPAGPVASHGYSRADNQGAGFGTYYDLKAGGRPESDAQAWDSNTWSSGRFGSDTLTEANFGSWDGKKCDQQNAYSWNGYSGYDYHFSLYIK